uniref:Uncharacterized protein n=1 Tax=Ignisphaera aggregans TaxID=334771 RepID=A0A7C5YXN6_9CREN
MPGVEEAFNALWRSFVNTLPGVIAAIIWIVIGVIIGVVVGDIVTRVLRRYVEGPLKATAIGKTFTSLGIEFSSLIGGLTKAFIISISLVAAISYIPIGGAAGELIYSVVGYLPYLIGGIAVITLGLVLAISLARYIGSILSTGFGEQYKSLVSFIENIILVGLVAIILTIAFTLLKIPSILIYPLLVGATAIALGVIVVVDVFKTIVSAHPDFGKLAPFVQFLVVVIFIIIGLSAIFSQFAVVGDVLRMLSIGIAIAFGVVLIPIAFYLVRKALIEAGKEK